MAGPRVSIIVPTLDEVAIAASAVRRLQPLRQAGHQVIVADGGSRDGTTAAVMGLADKVLVCRPGRGPQMNAGAAAADGDILLFLHADTRLPEGAVRTVCDVLADPAASWGRFDVRLSGRHPLLRVVERLISVRSRLTGIATGDQAMFVRRRVFERAGGFPQQPLLEDVALSATLKAFGRPVCLRQRVVTSSRRWEARGIVRTIVQMWWVRGAYALGVDPARLARAYRRG